jgi:hypothetical protein
MVKPGSVTHNRAWSMRTEGLNKSTPKWLKVKRSSLAPDGPHVHKEHAAQRLATVSGAKGMNPLMSPLRRSKSDVLEARRLFAGATIPVKGDLAAGEDDDLVSEGVAAGVEADGFALPGASVGGARDATLFENSGAPAQFDVDVDVSERWAKVFSTTNQAFYWRHDTTGEMTWDKPQGWVEPGLPVGWTEVPDRASGHSYYVNEATGEQTWQRPTPDA